MPDHAKTPAYEGEDSRPTSQKELWGWYSYGWAAETFPVVCMASFLPIALEQLARENGVLLSDRTTLCRDSTERGRHKELPACIVTLLGTEVNTASFAMYTFSLSVLVQALLIVSMSGAADHGRFRKKFLLMFAFTGALSMMLFVLVVPRLYIWGAVLAIVGNTCFGASFVLLNSFLPIMLRHHPSLIKYDPDTAASRGTESDEDTLHSADATTPLLPSDGPDTTQPKERIPAAVSPELRLSAQISSRGIGIGYTAGLLVQMAGIVIVVSLSSSTFSLRLVLFAAGLWWFCFSIPAALWLRPRPGPPLPAEFAGQSAWASYIIYAWGSLFKTVGKARRLKDIVIFLGAWFLLSDVSFLLCRWPVVALAVHAMLLRCTPT